MNMEYWGNDTKRGKPKSISVSFCPPQGIHDLLLLLLLLLSLFTAVELLVVGSSPYTSTDKTNNKYT